LGRFGVASGDGSATVVNFMNRKNQAEARIVDLLQTKFRLFEGVFGSSDEVLGPAGSTSRPIRR
jgi:hypothetical protein